MRDLIKFLTKYSFFFLFLLLEGISLILIVQHNSFQKSVFVKAARHLTGNMNHNVLAYREYFHLRETNVDLQEENSRLRNTLAKHDEQDSLSLNTQLLTEDEIRYRYYPARVINNSITRQYNYLTLNVGERHGLHEDMAVITEKGIVGIITGVSKHYSVVMSVLNRNFRIGAKIKRNNFFGVAEWDGKISHSITLKEIPLHANVLAGDTVVTSGYSAIFPEGIPIGIISEIKTGESNFYDIRVKLNNDFGNIYYVTVIINQHQKEQIMLETQTGI